MEPDELRAACRELGLSDVEAIVSAALPARALTPSAEVGRSHFGGRPNLPETMEWPRWKGRGLALVAQIDLAEHGAVPGLPQQGLLLFFYDLEQMPWGFDPEEAGSSRVLYVDPDAAPQPRNWPEDLPGPARLAGVGLSSHEILTVPPYEGQLFDDLGLPEEQEDAYFELQERFGPGEDEPERGLLGGHPDPIQGDMALECALVDAGLYCGDTSAYQDPRMPELREASRGWRLLLQVPSIEEAGMMWGDLGCLYVWIRDEDLRERRFERCWTILQCT